MKRKIVGMEKLKFLLLESDKFYRKRRLAKVEKLARIESRKVKNYEIWRFQA